jgi:hypothetical protein
MHNTTSQDGDPNAQSLFFKMFPQEVRDQIYDYVAETETNIGLHVALEENPQQNHMPAPKKA